MPQQQRPPIQNECPNCYGFSAEKREVLMTRHADRWSPSRGHWTEPVEWFRVTFCECDACGETRISNEESITKADYEDLADDLSKL